MEMKSRTTTRPMAAAPHTIRRRLGLRGELALAAPPTIIVLLVLAFVQALTQQRLLFASLASSAFLIYLDPGHPSNTVRTLLVAQALAAALGWALFELVGSGYVGAGAAMLLTIVLMVTLDVVHPPAVSTAMSFALRASNASNLTLFALALGTTALLVVLQRVTVRQLARLTR